MSDFTFTLTLDSRGIVMKDENNKDDATGKVALSFSNEKPATAVFKGKHLTFTLYGVRFRRKLYEPGHIEAEILIQSALKSDESINLAFLKELLYRRPVSMSVANATVAENYYIYDFIPQFEISAASFYEEQQDPRGQTIQVLVNGKAYDIYVKLDIFSMDKMLTINPYCKAYLGKKLRNQIVKHSLSKFSLGFEYELAGEKIKPTINVQMNLDYWLGRLACNSSELIQPYLVQYNESLYDFACRVANRCGEPLYFENGKLCIGLPPNSSKTGIMTAVGIGTPRRVLYHRISGGTLTSNSTYYRDSAKSTTSEPDHFNDDATKKTKDAFPDDAFTYTDHPINSEVAAEDYYILLYKDKFARRTSESTSTRRSYMFFNQDPALAALSSIAEVLNSTSLMEMLTTYAEQLVINGSWYGANKEKAQKNGLAIMEPYIIGSNNYATLFAKVDSSTSHWLTTSYYSGIRNNQNAMELQKISVDMGEVFENRKLGELVTVPGADNGVYAVTQIDLSSGVAWKRSYEEAVPLDGAADTRPSLSFQAIPLVNNTTFYPPALPGNPFRRANGPQPAFVTDADDPKRQGRVRIRFAWQPRKTQKTEDDIKNLKDKIDTAETAMATEKTSFEKVASSVSYYVDDDGEAQVKATRNNSTSETDFDTAKESYRTKCNEYEKAKRDYWEAKFHYSEDSSPWIRMVTPMATDGGGGMYFRPEVGDEVMVDFENGNIDHPFVTGALYSKTATAPDRGKRVIVSRNGHTIRFIDPDDTGLFIGGAWPFWTQMKNYGIPIPDLDVKGARPAVGGIELTDRAGLYRVLMSSHDRRISLSSPFGDVKVDALTGITLSAPNGKIKIEGQDVEITANNNLSITSGENIRKGPWWHYEGTVAAKIVGKELANVIGASFVDFTLLRTLMEIVIRPVDGTLKIKSNRYLLLEAGEGEATISADNYESESSLKSFKQADLLKKQRRVVNSRTATNLDKTKLLQALSQATPNIVHNNVAQFVRAFRRTQSDYMSLLHAEMFFHRDGTLVYCIKDQASSKSHLQYLFKTIKANHGYALDASYIDSLLGRNNASIEFHPNVPDSFNKNAAASRVRAVCEHVLALKKIVFKFQGKAFTESPQMPRRYRDDSELEGRITDILKHPYPMRPAPADVHDDPNSLSTWIKYVTDIESDRGDMDNLFANLTIAQFANWEKFAIRRIAAAIIKFRCGFKPGDSFIMIDSKYNQKPNPAAVGTFLDPPPTEDVNEPYSDSDWPVYINSLGIESFQSLEKPGIGESVWEGFTEPAQKNFLHFSEWKVWNDMAKGEIVFSNEKSVSYRFNSNGLPEKYIAQHSDELQSTLGDIKNVLRRL